MTLEAEQATLGSMLLDKEASSTGVRYFATGRLFTGDNHRIIFESITELF